ncbi:MAG: hypothetical protein ACHRXM_32050 [Isosphaerales bacterium]
MSHIPPDPELKAIESALEGLVPVSSRLDRDRLMFQAGALSARSPSRGRWAWPSIAATLAIALVSESLVLAVRPAGRVVDRIVVVHEPAPAPPSPPTVSTSSTGPTPGATIPSPSPVNVLSQRSLPEDALWPLASAGVSDSQRLQDLVLRFGLDALPERAPLVSRSGGQIDRDVTPLEPAGSLRRLDLEKLLNPGGPS